MGDRIRDALDGSERVEAFENVIQDNADTLTPFGGTKGKDAAGNAPILYRFGSDKESGSRLSRKAAEAKKKIGIHGVSTSETKPLPGTDYRSAPRNNVEIHFPVHNTPTRQDPNHRTVELPEPITPATVKIFNDLFGD